MYVIWNPYKTDTYTWKWMLAPLKEGREYALNIWKKSIKNDLRSN